MSSALPWAFSKLETYQLCPRQYYAKYVAKTIVEPPSEQIIWGNLVHKALELRLVEGASLPKEMNHWEPLATKLENAPGDTYCELKLAITYDLKPADFYDNDYGWNRGVEDIVKINGRKALTGDYKTGKKKPKSKQLQLSAVRLFTNFPDVEEVTSAFFWLPLYPQPGWMTTEKYTRDSIMPIVEHFREEVSELEWSHRNDAWPAKPNGLCKAWCGDLTCPHNGKRRR